MNDSKHRTHRLTSRKVSIGCESLEGRELLSGLTADVTRLVRKLETLPKSSISATQLAALTSDYQAIGSVASSPSTSTIAALKADLNVVIAKGVISSDSVTALTRDSATALESANVPATLAAQSSTDLQAVLTSSKLTKLQVRVIGLDLKAVLNDLSPSKR